MSTLRREQLIRIVHEHYPVHLEMVDPAHGDAEETRRLRAKQEQARGDRRRLVALMEAIEAGAPGVSVMDMSYLTYDAGYTLRMNADPEDESSTRWREIVACISVIAPVYALFQARIERSDTGEHDSTVAYSPDPDIVPLWEKTATLIEQMFGYDYLGPDLGLQPVPDVQVQNAPLGEATLYDALLTPQRD